MSTIVDQAHIPKEWREWWEERAAIMHFEGALPVETAEQEALECLMEHIASINDQHRLRTGEKKR